MQFPVMQLLVCTLLTVLVGMLWFSPLLFGRMWMRLTRVTSDRVDYSSAGPAYFVSVCSGFMLSLALWTLFRILTVTSPLCALALAVLLWAAFNALPLMSHGMHDGTPRALTWIYSGYTLVNAVLISMVLVHW